MSDKLKPCPFCGGVPVIHFQETTFSQTGEVYSVECNCGNSKAIGRTKNRLIERWNTRTDSKEVERLREQLRLVSISDRNHIKLLSEAEAELSEAVRYIHHLYCRIDRKKIPLDRNINAFLSKYKA